jgi:large subunit ribosomal protein L21
MYAVIKTGGKQYRVEQGHTLRVEKLEGEKGTALTFDEVLLVADGEAVKVGAPTIAGAKVSAEIIGQERGEKLIVFKFRRRKAYRRKNGHRQAYTAIKITGISA